MGEFYEVYFIHKVFKTKLLKKLTILLRKLHLKDHKAKTITITRES